MVLIRNDGGSDQGVADPIVTDQWRKMDEFIKNGKMVDKNSWSIEQSVARERDIGLTLRFGG